LYGLDDLVHARQVELRVDALAIEVHGHGDDVHVAGALAIAEQRTLDAVGAGQHAQLRRRHGTAAIVVRVQGHDDAVAARDVITEPLDLVRIDVRRAHLHRRRQVDDRLAVRRRLPDLDDRVADLDGEVELRAREALGRILEGPVRVRVARRVLTHQARAVHGNRLDTVAVEVEDLLALHRGRGVVHVHDRPRRARERLEGTRDQVLAGLGQHLDRDVGGNAIALDQFAQEGVVVARCGRKADLDFLEAELQQQVPHARFLGRGHRLDQGLVAIAQVHAAPARRTA
jgi:hypothetical protein